MKTVAGLLSCHCTLDNIDPSNLQFCSGYQYCVYCTGQVWDYDVTSLRLDPDYAYYYTHWTRLLATGIIPFTFLATVNVR